MYVLQVTIRIKPENVDAFVKKALENAMAPTVREVRDTDGGPSRRRSRGGTSR